MEQQSITAVLEIPTYELVYSEVSPELATYTGQWAEATWEFTTPEPHTALEVSSVFKTEAENNQLRVLAIKVWSVPDGTIWMVQMRACPLSGVLGVSWVQFILPILLLTGTGAIGWLFGDWFGGGSGGGGGSGNPMAMMVTMMPMFMMMMFMMMMMNMMRGMQE